MIFIIIELFGSTGFCVENSYFMNMQTNKKLEIKEVLYNILLPLDASWCVKIYSTYGGYVGIANEKQRVKKIFR